MIPSIREAKERWKRRIAWIEGVTFSVILLLLLTSSISAGYWDGLRFAPPWLDGILSSTPVLSSLIGMTVGTALYLHYFLRRVAANSVVRRIRRDPALGDAAE